MSLHETASATVGPFFHLGLAYLTTAELAGPDVHGERVLIQGRVFDGDGHLVKDALLEIWQADAEGQYAHHGDAQDTLSATGFLGFGRVPTDENGVFCLTTIKPGPVPGPGQAVQAPHLVVMVFMRGLLRHLLTRMYFPDEPANADDPVLALVPPDRRATLVAARAADPDRLEWNIILQGTGETVFFDY